MKKIKYAEIAKHVGEELGVSEWVQIDQDRVNLFADATGDHQYIHIDPEKAAKTPFGSTIAHGFLTLSLIPKFFESSIEVVESRMGVNYGLNKVRFPSPVPVGSVSSQVVAQAACTVTVVRE